MFSSKYLAISPCSLFFQIIISIFLGYPNMTGFYNIRVVDINSNLRRWNIVEKVDIFTVRCPVTGMPLFARYKR